MILLRFVGKQRIRLLLGLFPAAVGGAFQKEHKILFSLLLVILKCLVEQGNVVTVNGHAVALEQLGVMTHPYKKFPHGKGLFGGIGFLQQIGSRGLKRTQLLIGMCFKEINHEAVGLRILSVFQAIHTEHFLIIIYLQVPLGKSVQQVILGFIKAEMQIQGELKDLAAVRDGIPANTKPALNGLPGRKLKWFHLTVEIQIGFLTQLVGNIGGSRIGWVLTGSLRNIIRICDRMLFRARDVCRAPLSDQKEICSLIMLVMQLCQNVFAAVDHIMLHGKILSKYHPDRRQSCFSGKPVLPFSSGRCLTFSER